MMGERAPGVELGYLETELRAQILRWEFEEAPLIALEIGDEREGGHGQRIETKRMEQLDPEIEEFARGWQAGQRHEPRRGLEG